jgi:hypothetical protein
VSTNERERTDIPWPEWMLRYVGSDNPDALDDLMWSVGGSPPYGGVSYEEAAAVYELLEEYRGPGAASDEAYEAVDPFIEKDKNRKTALEIFRCADQIQSDSESYGQGPVERGLALAKKSGHRGAVASFVAFDAGLQHRAGNLPAARDRTIEALQIFLALADEDPVYEHRVKQTAQNAISFTAMSGDLDTARTLLHKLGSLIDPGAADQLRRALDSRR